MAQQIPQKRMPQKTITTTVTVVSRGENYPPGTEVTLDADEADRILQRFGGSAVKRPGDRPAADAAAVGDAKAG